MSPWYWAPIGLAILAALRFAYLVYDDDEYGFGTVGVLLLAALVWTDCLQAMHTHNPPPPATPVCTAKALEGVYDPSLKRTVPTWVCVGWSPHT